MLLIVVSFETFAREHGPRLRAGLVSAYGPDVGLDAAAEAMAYGFEHWHRLSEMGNPSGYLYRVGQTAARRSRRRGPALPAPEPSTMPMIEPGLAPALNDLSELQRTCVLLVHAFGWTRVEAALLLGIDESSVRTHIRRGMSKLQGALEENRDVTRS
jgi:DNA-directed RNA polymerase specialized sigma24 family protein